MSEHQAITERLKAISYLLGDEWTVYEEDDSDPEMTEYDIRAGQRSAGSGATVFTRICHTEQGEAAAEFLANAPHDIGWLLDEVVKWEGRTAHAALIISQASQLANEFGDGVSPECSEFADKLQDILERIEAVK